MNYSAYKWPMLIITLMGWVFILDCPAELIYTEKFAVEAEFIETAAEQHSIPIEQALADIFIDFQSIANSRFKAVYFIKIYSSRLATANKPFTDRKAHADMIGISVNKVIPSNGKEEAPDYHRIA